MPAFSIATNVTGERCELTVTGDLDAQFADDLAALGMLHLAEPAVCALAVDLAGVTFIDSSGLSALIRMRNAAVAAGKELALRNPSPRVQRMLELTALSGVFATESPEGTGIADR